MSIVLLLLGWLAGWLLGFCVHRQIATISGLLSFFLSLPSHESLDGCMEQQQN
jgi:hypothetical protein